MQPISVVETRKRPRFHMREEIRATVSGVSAIVINLSAEGIALRHAAPIKVNSTGSIRVESPENTAGISFRGRVRWSHISRTARDEGKLLYESGIQIEEVTDAVGGLLGRLIRAFGEKDSESMQRKQAAAEQRVKARVTPVAPATPPPARTISRDQILLIREASTKLKNSPDQALEWYDRARQSLAKRAATEGAAPGLHRRDVLSIWEYLGGRIDFEIIAAVLDAQNT